MVRDLYDAVKEQLGIFMAAARARGEPCEHVLLAGATHEPAVLLSERLARATDNVLGHCFYASDGASAVEIALKMSFHFWRNRGRPAKQRFVSLSGSYHGETLGALAVTDVALFKDTYAATLLLLDGTTLADALDRDSPAGAALATGDRTSERESVPLL